MKKTLIAAALATATLGFSGLASAGYDLGAACAAAFNAESGISQEDWGTACGCLVDSTKDKPDVVANLEASNGDQTQYTPETNAAIAHVLVVANKSPD